jgi:hypothetical protein
MRNCNSFDGYERFSNKCAKMSIWAGRDLRKPPVVGLVGSYEGNHPKGWLPMK